MRGTEFTIQSIIFTEQENRHCKSKLNDNDLHTTIKLFCENLYQYPISIKNFYTNIYRTFGNKFDDEEITHLEETMRGEKIFIIQSSQLYNNFHNAPLIILNGLRSDIILRSDNGDIDKKIITPYTIWVHY